MNVQLLKFQTKGDETGNLIALETSKNIPFEIKRVYYIWGTLEGIVRGKHAHYQLKQILVPLHGCCEIMLEYGSIKESVLLSDPTQGLYLEGLIWREMRNFSSDSVLMVLADRIYDERDYIRNYDEFLKWTSRELFHERQ